jgi:hypothetical protein
MAGEKLRAGDILAGLRTRHTEDIFVPECNLGSAFAGCKRIDAWAMKRTWKPMTTVGYEIKVSRGDFLNDNKWPLYLDFCHEFWFACPWKMIDPKEVPEGCGLVWMNAGGKMVRKVKAPRRNISDESLWKVMAYVLMSRTRITDSTYYTDEGAPRGIDYWKTWLETKKENYWVGDQVSKAINKRVGDVVKRNAELEALYVRYDRMKERLTELGLDPDQTMPWQIKSHVNELRGIIDPGLVRRMNQLGKSVTDMAEELEKLRGNK